MKPFMGIRQVANPDRQPEASASGAGGAGGVNRAVRKPMRFFP